MSHEYFSGWVRVITSCWGSDMSVNIYGGCQKHTPWLSMAHVNQVRGIYGLFMRTVMGATKSFSAPHVDEA